MADNDAFESGYYWIQHMTPVGIAVFIAWRDVSGAWRAVDGPIENGEVAVLEGPLVVPHAAARKAHHARLDYDARRNGCVPVWSEEYQRWCCGCEDSLHCCDQQCSIITYKSAARRREATK